MNDKIIQEKQKQKELENELYGEEFELLAEYTRHGANPYTRRDLRNKHFFVQAYYKNHKIERLSIRRTEINAEGRWKDGITWDELQKVKCQLGFGGMDAVEVYPKDSDVVSYANMRHLWFPKDTLDFIWRKNTDQNLTNRNKA